MTQPHFRTEFDSLGAIQVAHDKYWGAQTQRSLQNFAIGKDTFAATVIRALGIVKQAAARANHALGVLPADKLALIDQACEEVSSGKLNAHFPLSVWQTGSGTQTNMNANEVIANRAIELAHGTLGSKTPIHPNDDVNKSQSSNDSFPTVMHLAIISDWQTQLEPALKTMQHCFAAQAKEFATVVKIGRTHLMDATPITLGQEFSAFHAQLNAAHRTITQAMTNLHQIPLGGTAVGTGINSPPGFDQSVAAELKRITGIAFTPATNKFSQIAAHDLIVQVSGALKMLAVATLKIANDIRLLASGPRCGLGELQLPANEPGSSIMPGKVNPTQCEALAMICAQVIGNDAAVSIAGSHGHLQLNTFKPVMLHNVLGAMQLLTDAFNSFERHCLRGLSPNHTAITAHLNNSLMLITALNPIIGYDKAAQIAKHAHDHNLTLRTAATKLGILSAEDFDTHVQPQNMTSP
ncbi:MAG: class II fumarate hydratase [Pseudomonadota bacterium]|nr:class II fumarate hydratase [Pseudomonadota bacterium]